MFRGDEVKPLPTIVPCIIFLEYFHMTNHSFRIGKVKMCLYLCIILNYINFIVITYNKNN